MDGLIDNFLPHCPWLDMGLVIDRSSWVGDSVDESNSLLPYPIEAHEEKANLAVNMIPLSHITAPSANERQAIHSTPTFIYPNGNSCYNLGRGFFMDESQHSLEDLYSEINFSSRERMLENTSLPLLSSAGTSIISQAFPDSSVGNVLNNPLGFQHSPGDSHFISSLSPVWPTAYVSDSLLSPVLSQVGMSCGFGIPEECMENGINILDQRCPIGGEFRIQEQGDVGDANIPCFRTRSQIPLLENGQLCPQLSLSDEANSGKFHASKSSTSCLPSPSPLANACNGTSKPRVRARRGQATDPHSIAERLRRERIAERMRNLQELVPSSNKADKASILDEIIDHVKFLQLQVKVLSMSRLGAAGAVVPLITDLHDEDLSVPLLSPPIDQTSGPSKSEDNIALEQEVVQLMESNIKLAMQLLQNKGLCLMPSALASAISSGKTSSNTPASQRNKLLVNELNSLNNPSSDASKNSVKENMSGCPEQDEMLKDVSR